MFFLIGALNGTWVSRIPAMKERLDMSEGELGLLLLCPALGAMLAFRIAGPLTARYGSRRVTWGVTALLCVLLIGPAYGPTPLWTALALGGFGAASGLMDVAINAHGLEVESAMGRPILGSLHGFVSLGRLTGAGSGALAAWASMPPTGHLVIMAIAFEIVTISFGRGLLPHWAANAKPGGDEPEGRAAAATAKPVRNGTRRIGLLIALGAVCFSSSVSEGAMADWSGVYLRDVLNTNEALAASAYAAFSLAMLIGRFSGDRLTMRFGAATIVRSGGLLVAVALVLGVLTNTTVTAMAAFMCVGLGVSVLVPTAFRAAGNLPGINPGSAIATLATVSYVAFLAGPPVIGLISQYLTLRGGLLVVAVGGLIVATVAPSVEGRTIPLFARFTSKVPPPKIPTGDGHVN
jgi:MFS family permease